MDFKDFYGVLRYITGTLFRLKNGSQVVVRLGVQIVQVNYYAQIHVDLAVSIHLEAV